MLELCDAQLQRYANNLAEAEPEIAREIAAAYGESLIPVYNACNGERVQKQGGPALKIGSTHCEQHLCSHLA